MLEVSRGTASMVAAECKLLLGLALLSVPEVPSLLGNQLKCESLS